jgi:SAM-dependent methyltransferase
MNSAAEATRGPGKRPYFIGWRVGCAPEAAFPPSSASLDLRPRWGSILGPMRPSIDSSPAGTPDCCGQSADPRIARHFDRKVQEPSATGEPAGLHSVSQRVLEALGDVAESRPSILELGCGRGALTVSLLERGASRASGIDLSPASIEIARRRAEVAGARVAGASARASFEVGDGASIDLERHDWVVLDRVMCCYPHVGRLLDNSIDAAGSRYAFSVPESRGLRGIVSRAIVWLENLTRALRRKPCPGYVHDIRRIEQRLTMAGYRQVRASTAGLWYVAVFERR